MAIPENKTQLLEAIDLNYQKLKVELETISATNTRIKELEGHAKDTLMSVCDLVAYLLGWGRLVLKWHRKREAGQAVDFPETGYKWNELGKLAQKFYADYKNESYLELQKRLNKTVSEIVSLINTKTNKELYGMDWYDGWTLGRLIQFNTSSPYDNARKRLRK